MKRYNVVYTHSCLWGDGEVQVSLKFTAGLANAVCRSFPECKDVNEDWADEAGNKSLPHLQCQNIALVDQISERSGGRLI